MGNTLEKPVTDKVTSGHEDESLSWGVSSMQGWRTSNEDAHICENTRLPPQHYLFCVFDGHGGEYAAEYCRNYFVDVFLEQPSFQKYQNQFLQIMMDGKGSPTNKIRKSKKKPKPNKSNSARKSLEQALENTFDDMDRKLPNLLDLNESVSTNNSKKTLSSKKKNKKANTRTVKRQDEKLQLQWQLLKTALQDTFLALDLQLLKDVINKDIYKHPSQSNPNPTYNDGDGDDDDWGEFAEAEQDHDSTEPVYSENHHGDNIPGTTATVVLVTPNFILCANAGDSRAILATSTEVKVLSNDHKPDLPLEKDRIEKANGTVTLDARVDGELAVSRGLGDFGFKDYHRYPSFHIHNDGDASIDEAKRRLAQALKVSPFPEVLVHPRNSEGDQFLIVACDGIWDVMKNSYCRDEVDTLMAEGESNMALIAEEILDHCLKKGSRDNMTLIIVKFPAQQIGTGGGVAKRRSRR